MIELDVLIFRSGGVGVMSGFGIGGVDLEILLLYML